MLPHPRRPATEPQALRCLSFPPGLPGGMASLRRGLPGRWSESPTPRPTTGTRCPVTQRPGCLRPEAFCPAQLLGSRGCSTGVMQTIPLSLKKLLGHPWLSPRSPQCAPDGGEWPAGDFPEQRGSLAESHSGCHTRLQLRAD